MGDFNTDPKITSYNTSGSFQPWKYKTIIEIKNRSFLDCIDLCHNITNEYPFSSWHQGNKYTRIDLFWISTNLAEELLYCSYYI